MGILCIIDGMTDGPSFGAGLMPAFRRMGEAGARGTFVTTPPGRRPDSFVCILTLLGLSPGQIPQGGRAWLEALGAGVAPLPEDLVLRGSLVSLDGEGRLSRLGCPGIPTALRQELVRRFGLYPLGGYKNLIILPGEGKRAAQYAAPAPHDRLGCPLEELLPLQPDLRRLVLESRELLEGRGALLPWGASSQTLLPPLRRQGAAVCRTEIVAGIAKGLGMDVRIPPGATADTDTDLAAKREAAASLAGERELVLLHINGADEAAHRRNRREKEGFLEAVDRLVLEPLSQRGIPLLVTGDHGTSWETGGHLPTPQPFVLWNGGRRGELGRLEGTQAVSLLTEGKV